MPLIVHFELLQAFIQTIQKMLKLIRMFVTLY